MEKDARKTGAVKGGMSEVAPRNIPLPDLSQLEHKRPWQQSESGSWWSAGGKVEFTSLAVGRIGRLGIRLGLTDRPTKLLVAPNQDHTMLLMMPVRDHPQAVEIRYGKSTASIDLHDLFTYLGRFPLPRTREFHSVAITADEVTIDKVTGPALEMPLTATETRWKKPAQKKDAKKAAQQQAAPAAKPAEQSAPAPQATEQAAAAKDS